MSRVLTRPAAPSAELADELPAARRGRVSPALVALLVFVGLALLLFANTWASPRTRWIGVGGDPQLNMWFLRWTPWAVSHGHNPFFTDHLNHPAGVNLMWNTQLPLPALALWPVTVALGPIVAYNVLATLAFALSAWCAFLVLRRFVRSPVAAGAGGLLYGFSPYMVAHGTGHLNLTLVVLPPLMALCLHELVVGQQRSWKTTGALLGALAAAQLLIAEEVLTSAVLAASVGLLLLGLLHRRDVRPRAAHAARGLACALAVGLALAAWPLGQQFFGRQRVTHGVIQPRDVFVTDALGLVVPNVSQELSPGWATRFSNRFTGHIPEWGAYMGFPLLFLLAFTAVRFRRRPGVRFAAWFGVVLVVLTFGPTLHVAGHRTGIPLPWRLIDNVPVVRNMLPTRLSLYVFLVAGFLLAVFVDRALADTVARRRRIGLAVAVLALVPLLPRLPFFSKPALLPSFFTTNAVREVPKGSVALVAPFSRGPLNDNAMLWQAAASMRYRMPAGYYIARDRDGEPRWGAPPTPLLDVMDRIENASPPPVLDDGLRRKLLSDLRRWRVETVLVGPMYYQREMLELFRDLLGHPPRLNRGVYVWSL